MPKARRSNDWGFPRWRGYGSSREATNVRICDRHGCDEPGDCPAPKAPNSPDRWYFCQKHAAEYNKEWDYFEGLDKAEKEERARAERAESAGYAESAHYGWTGSGDGSRSADEMRALELLELEADDQESLPRQGQGSSPRCKTRRCRGRSGIPEAAGRL